VVAGAVVGDARPVVGVPEAPVDVGAGDGSVPPPLWVGGGPVATEVVGELRDEETPGSAPREKWDGMVWKLRTATRPATVATTTITVRLIRSSPVKRAVDVDPAVPSEGERLLVDTVPMHTKPRDRCHHQTIEAFRSADVDVARRDIRKKPVECGSIDADLPSRADELMELTAPSSDQVCDFVTVNDVIGSGGTHDDGDIH
jgi:hypothetical protein